ncbi:MAG: peptidase domain protein [Frankiales bacterium]|nr:peptidase domain protein [Frankiales bacterium]
MPGSRSATFGVWVGVGSRDESPKLAGASHFLEHLLFKGTERRDALDIAEVMDAVGGEMNAFTSKEYTCYYARVLDTDLPLAVDVVCDMVTASLLDAEDVEAERGVILEEIAMHDDDPADVVHDALAAALYGSHPLGRPVIGSVESVEGLSRASLAGWWRRRYTPADMVVSAAGGLDHAVVVRLVKKAFGPLLVREKTPAPVRGAGRRVRTQAGVVCERRPSEQANLVLGVPALQRDDPRKPALQVLSAGLGGGTSSRLFQEVREKRGLAYSVYSYTASHADTGMLGVYAGCAPARTREVVDLCREVVAGVARDGLTDDEVARTKGQLRASTVLGLEDSGSRMSRLGKSELVHGSVLGVQDLLDRIDAVTPDDVRALAAELLVQPPALGVLGPFDEDEAQTWLT